MNLSKPAFPTLSGARLTSNYGMRTHPITGKRTLHTGTDYAPPVPGQTGVPIYATQDGIVRRSQHHATMGHHIYLEHTSDSYSSVYMHLARREVQENQRVKKGQRIGTMGTTGTSTGIHLHFMVATSYPPQHNGSNLIDPVDYLKGGGRKMKIKEDGRLGPATIKRLQEFFGTKQDGVISSVSVVVKELQKFLNKYGQ